MILFLKKVLFPILIFTASFIITGYLISSIDPDPKTETYTLKAYKNTVALYKNTEIIKTYDNIVLNTLPKKDIQTFNKGITVTTLAQAEIILEDFDN